MLHTVGWKCLEPKKSGLLVFQFLFLIASEKVSVNQKFEGRRLFCDGLLSYTGARLEGEVRGGLGGWGQGRARGAWNTHPQINRITCFALHFLSAFL